jgi:hypothetical protein
MKNALDSSEKKNENDMPLEKDEILLNRFYDLDRQNNHLSVDGQNENATEVKWSIKEKLFLISFVLINGDSNWTYVSEQLNKWMESISTSNFENNLNNKRTFSVCIYLINLKSFLLINSMFYVHNLFKQCSIQYKTIVKNYSKKHGMLDLK